MVIKLFAAASRPNNHTKAILLNASNKLYFKFSKLDKDKVQTQLCIYLYNIY